jgi:hypothetical protein
MALKEDACDDQYSLLERMLLLEERALAVPSSTTLRLADSSDHDLEKQTPPLCFRQKQGQ